MRGLLAECSSTRRRPVRVHRPNAHIRRQRILSAQRIEALAALAQFRGSRMRGKAASLVSREVIKPLEKTTLAQIEDMITALYRLNDPDIERIGVEHDNACWRCHRVWVQKDAPNYRMTRSRPSSSMQTKSSVIF